jgi:hypothetical protein
MPNGVQQLQAGTADEDREIDCNASIQDDIKLASQDVCVSFILNLSRSQIAKEAPLPQLLSDVT